MIRVRSQDGFSWKRVGLAVTRRAVSTKHLYLRDRQLLENRPDENRAAIELLRHAAVVDSMIAAGLDRGR